MSDFLSSIEFPLAGFQTQQRQYPRVPHVGIMTSSGPKEPLGGLITPLFV